MKLDEKINELLKYYSSSHSRFQIEQFIIGSQGPAWFQFKQCLREIDSRWKQIKDIKDDILIAELNLTNLINKKFIRKKKREINALKYKKELRNYEHLKTTLNEIYFELKVFVERADGIKSNYWGKDELSAEKMEKLEINGWFEKTKYLMALDLITIGSLSRGTAEMIYSMPKGMKKELLNNLNTKESQQKLIKWIME